jgi:hypothetical protein
MPNLTPDQLNTIAERLLAISDAIDDYLDSPPAPLLSSQETSLTALRNKLNANAEIIANTALTAALDDAADAVSNLNKITAHIDTDIQHLTDVQKIIDLAGAALNLTVAIIGFETNPGAIPGAVSGLVDAIKALKPASGS